MDTVKLEYNTEREPLAMAEYGRSVQTMVEQLKTIEDKAKRSEQARAVVKVMELLNPSVRTQEDYLHKLWDHLYIMAGFDLDVDAPYPCPVAADFVTRPVPLPMKGTKIKASHYGRNIEKIIELAEQQKDEQTRDALIKAIATYMRQQYLIWNKDSVDDETIFSDLEKLSEGKVSVPEGMSLSRIAADADFSRPNIPGQEGGQRKNRNRHQGRQGKNRRR